MQAYWAIIPAAGVGNRFSSGVPKQYYLVNGKTVIEHTLQIFIDNPLIKQIVVALSPEDTVFTTLPIADNSKIVTVMGGETRMQSVQNALAWIHKVSQPSDWVLVHDAVRPALHPNDLNNLIMTVAQDEVGGVLVTKVLDTIKFATQSNRVSHTVSREALWHALTPQLFRVKILQEGLKRAEQISLVVTDEAHAVEQSGEQPKIVKSVHHKSHGSQHHRLSVQPTPEPRVWQPLLT